MLSKVYIIGCNHNVNSIANQNKFYEAQKRLEKLNLEVFNPIDSYLKFSGSIEKAIQFNLECLLSSNAVYVLKDSIKNSQNRIEIMLAIKLNKLIMHEF